MTDIKLLHPINMAALEKNPQLSEDQKAQLRSLLERAKACTNGEADKIQGIAEVQYLISSLIVNMYIDNTCKSSRIVAIVHAISTMRWQILLAIMGFILAWLVAFIHCPEHAADLLIEIGHLK